MAGWQGGVWGRAGGGDEAAGEGHHPDRQTSSTQSLLRMPVLLLNDCDILSPFISRSLGLPSGDKNTYVLELEGKGVKRAL